MGENEMTRKGCGNACWQNSGKICQPGGAITSVCGRCVAVPGDDIDTDRIVPARFLTATTFDGFGKCAFYDERFDRDGKSRGHPFDDPRLAGCAVLLVNKNFGCGSSREHAPQALLRRGIRAIVGESFAAIFEDNCCAIGIPAVRVGKEEIGWMMEQAGKPENARESAVVSVERGEVSYCGRTFKFSQDGSRKKAFLQAKWDALAVLLEAGKDIERVSGSLAYLKFCDKPKVENQRRALASSASEAEAGG